MGGSYARVWLLLLFLLFSQSNPTQSAAVSDLDTLWEVQDALGHAQKSISDLSDLISEFITTNSPEITTRATSGSTIEITTDALSTGAPTVPPVSTNNPIEPSTSTGAPTEPPISTNEPTEPPKISTTTGAPTEPPIASSTTGTPTEPPPSTGAPTEPSTTTSIPTEPPTASTTTGAPTEPPTTTPPPPTTTPWSTSAATEEPTDPSKEDGNEKSVHEVLLMHILESQHLDSRNPRYLWALEQLNAPRKAGFRSLLSVAESLAEEEEKEQREEERGEYIDEDDAIEDDGEEEEEETTEEIISTNEPELPWLDQVYDVLNAMADKIVEISEGSADHYHAVSLDLEASKLDKLVLKGSSDPTLIEDVSPDDMEVINSILEDIDNANAFIDKQIDIAKKDQTELIVTLSVLSVLFVGVLVALVVVFVRPWDGKCKSPKSKKPRRAPAEEVPADESREFANMSFVQHRTQATERIHMDSV